MMIASYFELTLDTLLHGTVERDSSVSTSWIAANSLGISVNQSADTEVFIPPASDFQSPLEFPHFLFQVGVLRFRPSRCSAVQAAGSGGMEITPSRPKRPTASEFGKSNQGSAGVVGLWGWWLKASATLQPCSPPRICRIRSWRGQMA